MKVRTSILFVCGVLGSGARVFAGMPTGPTIGQFVLYAERAVVLGDRSRASRGDIGVRTLAGSSAGTQLAIGAHDETGDLFAPSTTLGRRAKVGDVQTASLQNDGADSLGAVSAFPAASMPPLPLALASSSGSDVQVPPHQVRSLSPGEYGALTLANSSTLLLATGKYSFSSVTIGEHSKLVADPGGVDVRIVRSLGMGPSTQIHPRGRDKGAKDFVIAIAGDDGPDASSPVVRIGPHSRLQALLAAPHGTVSMADSVEVKGAVAGFDIQAGEHDEFIFEDGFPVSGPGQQGSQQLHGYVKAPTSSAPLIGPVPQDEILNVAIGLPLRDPNGLAAFLKQVSDPTSPLYRHYLTPAQFVATYGPTTADYQALTAFAQANGLSVTQAFSNNALLRVTGPVGAIERAFYVNLNNYARPDTSSFYALDRDPSLDLTMPVLRISGLDNYVVGTPSTGGSGPATFFWGNDFRNAYLGAGSACSGLTGAGQSIALFELDTYNPADITLYEALAGLPNVALNPVSIVSATGGNSPSPVSNAKTRLEVAGDMEMALSMAPGATITPFLAPSIGGTDPTNAILNAMATQTPLSFQISISWNTDADENTGQALSQLAAQGQSLFQSSGDFGAYGTNPPGGLKNLDYPYATVVGGTVLTMNLPGASYQSETTWTGSGGGILQYPLLLGILDIPIPYYQEGAINSSNGGSSQFRNVPDVSAVATQLECVVGGAAVGCAGTSFATPLWAGFVALMNQQGQINASPQVGFINPALYAVAGTGLYGSAFNDVNDGSTNSNNGSVTGYPAVAGYDLATGLGSPKCGLIPALVGGQGGGGGGGGGNNVNVSATETQTGPDVCVNGTGFAPGGGVRVEYFGIPGRVAPLPGGEFATVKPDGSFKMGVDTENEGRLVTCNAAEIGNTVTVDVTERDSNGNIVGTGNGTIPAGYWCGNAGVSTNFNGGCP